MSDPGFRTKMSEKSKWITKRVMYGVTKEIFDKMLSLQSGVCAICSRPPGRGDKFTLHVDHNHTTGSNRELLCRACNHGIGNFREDGELLLKAISYLKKHSPSK